MNNVSLDDSCAAFCLFFFFFISSPNTFFFITLPEPCSPHVHIKIIVSTFMRKYQNGLQLGEHSKGTLQLVCLSVLHFLLPHIAIHLLLHTFVRRLWQTYSLYHMVVYCKLNSYMYWCCDCKQKCSRIHMLWVMSVETIWIEWRFLLLLVLLLRCRSIIFFTPCNDADSPMPESTVISTFWMLNISEQQF